MDSLERDLIVEAPENSILQHNHYNNKDLKLSFKLPVVYSVDVSEPELENLLLD